MANYIPGKKGRKSFKNNDTEYHQIIAEADVSRSASGMITTNKQDKRTSVILFSSKQDTRDNDPGAVGSAAASYLVYIIPITCTLTLCLLTVLSFICCNKCRQLCNILNKKHQINSDYELTTRVYENNGSTNCYDTPDTNTTLSMTLAASESSYESVEQFQKNL